MFIILYCAYGEAGTGWMGFEQPGLMEGITAHERRIVPR